MSSCVCTTSLDGVDMKGITNDDLAKAFEEFKERCENDYYVEYFWFPSQKKCWVHTWNNDGNPANAKDYPSPAKAKLQGISTLLSEVLNNVVWPLLPGRFQMKVVSFLAMAQLPERTEKDPIVTSLVDALHFQRGVHNMRVNNMEWELPM